MLTKQHNLNRTYVADWREALDNAEYWHHACDIESRASEGAFILTHFDNPHNMIVDEIGHIELIEGN